VKEAVTVMLWYISGAGSPSFTLIKGPLNEFVAGSGEVLASDVKNVKTFFLHLCNQGISYLVLN